MFIGLVGSREAINIVLLTEQEEHDVAPKEQEQKL